MIVQNSIKVPKVSESMKSTGFISTSIPKQLDRWTASHQQGVAGEAIAHRRRPQHVGHAAVRVPRRGADLRCRRRVAAVPKRWGDQRGSTQLVWRQQTWGFHGVSWNSMELWWEFHGNWGGIHGMKHVIYPTSMGMFHQFFLSQVFGPTIDFALQVEATWGFDVSYHFEQQSG